MLIQNYGLYWKLELIFWGRGSVPGHLKGRETPTSDPVDFRDQQGVYVLYDDSFKIVYIGQTGAGKSHRLLERLKNHTKDALSDRWSRFSWFGIRTVNQNGKLRKEVAAKHPVLEDVLNHIEAILIATAEPPLNRQSGRFGYEVEKYLQFTDEENLGPDGLEMIRQIWEERGSGQ